MARFLHTSDWQLGMKAGYLGEAGSTVRKYRLDAVRRVMSIAAERHVQFVLVAGDVFENNAVSKETIEQVLDIFERFSAVPIYILPGNHDPFTPESVYLQRIWKAAPKHVRVLSEREPVKLPEEKVSLYPCPLYQKQSSSDPTEWIPKRDAGETRIGVAHGTLNIGMVREPNFPISQSRVEDAGLDYMALGDWHSLFIHKDPSGAQRTVYSGTPERTSFDESDPGHVVIVEVEPHEQPRLETVESQALRWLVWDEHLECTADVEGIAKRMKELDDPSITLLRLAAKGVVDAEAFNRVGELTGLVKGLLYVDVDSSALRLRPSVDGMIGVIPEGVLRDVAESIEAMLSRQTGFSDVVQVRPEELGTRLARLEGFDWTIYDADDIQKALCLLYQWCEEEKK